MKWKIRTLRWLPGLLLLLLACTVVIAMFFPFKENDVSAQQPDTVYASPISGGCYLVTPSTCKIKVSPFTINTNASLYNFKLQANGQTIYDFSTDLSNPPLGNYTPSLVKQDFAAHCGQTYTLNLIAADSSAPSTYYNLGSTRSFLCPEGKNELFLPDVMR